MNNIKNVKFNIDRYILISLIAIQPLLDAVAFWTSGSSFTIAGILRLLIMFAMPLYALIKIKEKKRIIIPMMIIGLYCTLHVLNGFRLGYISFGRDVQYLLRVVQMPVIAVSVSLIVCDEESVKSVMKGFLYAAVLYLAMLLISYLSGTWNSTYGGGLGLSGWVTDDNRSAGSIIMVIMCTFVMHFGLESKYRIFNYVCPLVVFSVLLLNGTKGCYLSAFVFLIGYTAFFLSDRIINRTKLRIDIIAICLILSVAAVLVYPLTPRGIKDKRDEVTDSTIASAAFSDEMRELGYDFSSMNIEEKMADPVLKLKFQTYYYQMMYEGVPALLDDYPIERIFKAYNMTDDMNVLIDTRNMKRTYAGFLFEDSDALTKILGFEFQLIGQHEHMDLENDWPALFYYYGYLGFALYIGFILYFIIRIILKLFSDFKCSITLINFSSATAIVLILGLAQLSGHVLRRPNVSIYLSVLLAIIHYMTAKKNSRIF